MWDKLFDGSFMPHGHCFLWREDLLFLHVAGDAITAFAYFLIPIGIVKLVKKRDDLRFNHVFLLFAAFILFCGLTHILGVINIWHGYYYVEGTVKMLTGVVSLMTAFLMWRLMPAMIDIPSRADLSSRNEELLKTKRQLEEINKTLEERVLSRTKKLERLAQTDSLTGLLNHRAILTATDTEIERSRRYQSEFSLLMLDLDYFKKFNDNYGHLAGDNLLEQVAKTLQFHCRKTDIIGRYGGEEFLVVCPETGVVDACELAERLLLQIAEIDLGNKRSITTSIGVATMEAGQSSLEMVKAVDDAVYQAKANGRNTLYCANRGGQ